MTTTHIGTNEYDLPIIRGSYGLAFEPRELALASVKYLYTDLTDLRKYYIRLGFHLDEFDRCNYCVDFGYSCMYEFCENNLGMDKSAVSRCINVYREFNASNERRYVSNVEIRGSAMELADCWKDFSYTQLCEMLPLSLEDRKKVKPDMTVRQIRDFKKSLKQNTVAATQPENKKPFDYRKYENSCGIVRQNLVKYCTPVKDNVVYDVFDRNGKFVGGNVWCELIYADKNHYIFRLLQSPDNTEDKPD